LDPYAVLNSAYAALGRAALPTVAPENVKAAARRGDGRELPDAEVFALAAEVQALAALLGSGR
jgi:hypothetical protein